MKKDSYLIQFQLEAELVEQLNELAKIEDRSRNRQAKYIMQTEIPRLLKNYHNITQDKTQISYSDMKSN